MNGEQVTFMVRTENNTTGDQQLDRHLLDFAHRIHHFRGDSASNGPVFQIGAPSALSDHLYGCDRVQPAN
ncbi:hypothetical protein ARMSODRAFT_662691 [Armillaria solidipes]|uniref:Uncharacterized protein n=1 Tax=Armillaria solidipes TaxID=1076256 RepID=A0A2H3BEQ6_9AGAR|nr:hypothetical protein ARMSODRAFT_662691 [Armillaria solidipes]